MVSCLNCSAKLEGDEKFCHKCGAKVGKVNKTKKEFKEEKGDYEHKVTKQPYKINAWVWVIIGIVILVAIIIGVNSYCNQTIPKEVVETYTEQEPYTVYEIQTYTKEVAEDYCDNDSDCTCTSRFLWVGYCMKCNCEFTRQIPITKYRDVQKQRMTTKWVKRCS